MRVTLTWVVPPPSKNLEAIRGFQVRELPYDSSGTVELVPTQVRKPLVSLSTYSHALCCAN